MADKFRYIEEKKIDWADKKQALERGRDYNKKRRAWVKEHCPEEYKKTKERKKAYRETPGYKENHAEYEKKRRAFIKANKPEEYKRYHDKLKEKRKGLREKNIAKEWRNKNRDKIKIYYQTQKLKGNVKAKNIRYLKNNKDKVRGRWHLYCTSEEYRIRHREYREKNKEAINSRKRWRYKNDPLFREKTLNLQKKHRLEMSDSYFANLLKIPANQFNYLPEKLKEVYRARLLLKRAIRQKWEKS